MNVNICTKILKMFKFENLISKLLRLRKVIFGLDSYISQDIQIPCKTIGKVESSWTIIADLLDEQSIVYSFGVGNEISFDLELINAFDLQIFAFDPTPKSIDWILQQKLPKQFIFNPIGLANYNGKAVFYPPINPNHISASIIERKETKNEAYKVDVRTLRSLMVELEHNSIDLLKISIEGAEYQVINNIINENIKPKQILVCFNHNHKNISSKQTVKAVEILRKSGYLIFHISKMGNTVSFVRKDAITTPD